ncbi:xanthine dehydrogenase family protein molybdopterin-binding subunit [Flavobacterium rhizosphaerae]|uniref:Xanthine dehydrogenase family protein molybdopterin-binding subunit n=1 Tax=Flavobacterium rhizosphaerae TaxID=3163298 RepID=A0ABW8YUW5_9FLAO
MNIIEASGVGQSVDRIDGRLKVTGMAKYASEFPVKNVIYAQGVNSTIAKGRIIAIDTAEAEKLPGVLKVITYKNAEKLKNYEKELTSFELETVAPVFQTNEIHYYGQYVACVVAETFEQAQYGCSLVKVMYEEDKADIHMDKNRGKAFKPDKEADYSRGDMDKGMRDASAKVEETYTTPIEHQHPMELHAAIVSWEKNGVKMYASQQILAKAKKSIADTFMIPETNVQIIVPYVGGGFGSKLNIFKHVTMAVMASKMLGRPVQITVTRQQMFTNTGMRQFDEQKMRLGATKSGVLTALGHYTTSHCATNLQYYESCGNVSKMLYNTPNNEVTHRLIPLNIQVPNSMRAPGEATGSFALESAIDELAWKLNMDPIEFRIKNDTQTDLGAGKPFSSRLLTECLRIGADKFGWDKRKAPGTNKKGNWLIGYGVSAASRRAPYMKTNARVIVELKDGKSFATIQMDGTDIGTGTYTILGQTASDYLKIPIENITVELGDSDFPVTPGSGGSWGAASYSNGVRKACENLISGLQQKAGGKAGNSDSVAGLMTKSKLSTFTAEGTAEPSEAFKNHSVFSFGANFTEVWVDKDTGMYRIKRMVNVASAGKIMNPKTAYSQVIGGLTMGAGMVIAEQSKIEPNYGNFITRTLADYHVPVNLDLANVDVVFLPEEDKIANEMGVKGIGELGITSVAASIANAIFNATGKRMRHLPITPEKLIMAKPEKGI